MGKNIIEKSQNNQSQKKKKFCQKRLKRISSDLVAGRTHDCTFYIGMEDKQ
jgi:hypothetical protein